MVFENRQEAGKLLAIELAYYKNKKPIVLALPRGGVPVGFEIARILHAPLDVFVARKIGIPQNPEFGMGAVAEGNVKVFNERIISLIPKEKLEGETFRQEEELKRRIKMYRHNKPLPPLTSKVVILVDDGLATGVTARAAITSIKKQKPKMIIFASPVCAYDTAKELKDMVDDIVCVATLVDLKAVGMWYQSPHEVVDEEVVEFLKQSRKRGKQGFGGEPRRKWSQKVATTSNALDLESGVFTFKDPKRIAASLKKSAEVSQRRKATPYHSAMSMLNFYVNRAGRNLDPQQKKVLERARDELRKTFH